MVFSDRPGYMPESGESLISEAESDALPVTRGVACGLLSFREIARWIGLTETPSPQSYMTVFSYCTNATTMQV